METRQHKQSAQSSQSGTPADSDAAATNASRKRGRPRKNASGDSVTRQVIIATASKLFFEQGYLRTSMSEIARAVNMDPSSLYYYFSSKEALLTAIFSGDEMPPTLEQLGDLTNNAAEALYALILLDVASKCALPFDFIEFESVTQHSKEKFESFFDDYKAFYETLVALIQRGIDNGIFIDCEADERAVTILSINEGLQHHYHAKMRGRLLLDHSGYTVRNYAPEDIGRLSALSVLPSLLVDRSQFHTIAEGGYRVYREISKGFKR